MRKRRLQQGPKVREKSTPESTPISIDAVTIQKERDIKQFGDGPETAENDHLYMYETGWNSPSGLRATYNGDDTRVSNIKKPLEEACGE